MLDEYRRIYQECANLIPDWNSYSKDELANRYIDCQDIKLKDCYLSAIVLKFWHLISHFYYKQGVRSASEEECYEWIIEGITAALQQHVWTDPSNKLFNDPRGPEKAMMVCIMSDRANYYQAIKYDKRCLNYNNLSLEALDEISSDGFFVPYYDKYIDLYDYIREKVITYFDKGDFFSCFILDLLFNYNVIEVKKEFVINIRKVSNYISKFDDEYVKSFSLEYSLPVDKVSELLNKLKNMPQYMMNSKINQLLNSLKKDMLLKELLIEGKIDVN